LPRRRSEDGRLTNNDGHASRFPRRIRSVKNTQQITRAMKFVAAARLRRAQEAAIAARRTPES